MSIAGGVVSILDWLKDKLPIPGRLEGIKNEIDKLKKERKELLDGTATLKASKRISAIDSRLSKLDGMLKNASNSS